MGYEWIHTNELLDLSKTIAVSLFDGLDHPWKALPLLGAFIESLGAKLPPNEFERVSSNIYIARDAKIAANAAISGPCIIDHEAEIRHCAYIRGNAIVGKNCVVGNSTELKNALLFDNTQAPHFNYVGDSILGWKAHMGAGSITSNVRSDKRLVVVHAGGKSIETGMKKFGAILGDRVEIGCNAVLNPGVVIGRGSMAYPTSSVRGVVPPNSIYKNDGSISPIRPTIIEV